MNEDGTFTISIDSFDDEFVPTGISSLVTNQNISIANINENNNIFKINDNVVVKIGDDFQIEASQLKACLRVLLKQAKDEFPEDFI
jgi:ribosomal protein S1